MDPDVLQKQYHAFDVKLRETKNTSDDVSLYIPLAFKKTRDLLKEDKQGRYFTERNDDFLAETGLVKQIRFHDAYLRPYLVSHCRYDYIQGSHHSRTPLRYEVNYRTYIFVTRGTLQIKLTPPKYTKFLHHVEDYELFEFRSPVDVWDNNTTNSTSLYKQDYDKIKCLDVTLRQGEILFLPAFWWYSVQFEADSVALVFHYKTYMNALSLLPQYLLHGLQMQNIKRKTIRLQSNDDTKEDTKRQETKRQETKIL
jgi:hypothetical protein